MMHVQKIKLNQTLYPALGGTVLFFFLLATMIQGSTLSILVSGRLIGIVCIVVFLCIPCLLYLWRRMGKLTEERVVFLIVFAGMFLHCCYVLLSGLYERQHDEGVYTGIATSQVNPGHIGYIEYIYKFHKLPDINPYALFSYYHPPLHYVLSGLWLILLTALGMPEELAFENLQALPLLYTGLFMLLTYRILKETGAKGRGLYAGMVLVSLHPALTILSGSINNDMLSTLLLGCCILTTLHFIQDRSLKNLLLLALSIGLGMLCKINTAVVAFPVGLILLMDLIDNIRTKDKKKILRCIRNDALFGLVCGGIGLAWIVRNLVRFHVKPGISSATEASVMYTGDYSIWARVGIPALVDWHFDFPFHPLSGDVIHNTWVIMFQTSLFGEIYPTESAGMELLLCRIAYPAAILFATASAVLFGMVQIRKLKSGIRETVYEGIFLLAGYGCFLLSFAVFSLKYPYTCSSDFRYIVINLVYIALGLSDSDRFCPGKIKAAAIARIIQAGVCVTLVLTTMVYVIWMQWGGVI
ncbi:MAG: glycosyltransferase family 39 protein [Muribaculaceae bacterium]|nr:glycosyltransferase family 39 protein [Muribaculaceae bacterium]